MRWAWAPLAVGAIAAALILRALFARIFFLGAVPHPTVSDGKASASLAAFSIAVTQISLGSATLSWTPPTQNEDGTPLTNLAGYRIRFGMQSGNYPSTINLTNPGLATYVLSGLAAGTYYIVISAVNQNGVESSYSNEASTTAT